MKTFIQAIKINAKICGWQLLGQTLRDRQTIHSDTKKRPKRVTTEWKEADGFLKKKCWKFSIKEKKKIKKHSHFIQLESRYMRKTPLTAADLSTTVTFLQESQWNGETWEAEGHESLHL